MTGVCHFRNTKTSSTRRWRSESSTSSSVATSQRSAKGFRARILPSRVEPLFIYLFIFILTFPHFHRLQIKEKMDENGAPSELTEQLHHVRDSFDGLKSCSWNWVAVFYWTEVNGGDRTPRCTYYVGQRRVCPRCIPAVTGARDKETRRHDKARTHCSLTHLEPPTKPVCVFLTCENTYRVQLMYKSSSEWRQSILRSYGEVGVGGALRTH